MLINDNDRMLVQQKQQDLEIIVLEGWCPHCRSVEIEYYELEPNQVFGFKCCQCSYKETHTAKELTYLSAHW